ncbi:Hypothetical predicted protein [Podarcis lilfordi]|uniref:Uncharacterized protein n=1 Tax=Podarcis lilfordi TaxID=74358 RepID=A0AA35PC85_9SAUR|nr:Hypothetical predicted protein [Podarcis lilfordi]
MFSAANRSSKTTCRFFSLKINSFRKMERDELRKQPWHKLLTLPEMYFRRNVKYLLLYDLPSKRLSHSHLYLNTGLLKIPVRQEIIFLCCSLLNSSPSLLTVCLIRRIFMILCYIWKVTTVAI